MSAPQWAPVDDDTADLLSVLRALPGRCPGCGFHVRTQGCRCAPVAPSGGGLTDAEWAVFTAALREAAVDGVVSQTRMRPLIRGRIFHKHIGQAYRRATRLGLLVEMEPQRSKDHAGKNAGRWEPRYKMRSAA